MKLHDLQVSAPVTLAFVAEGLCWGSFAAQIPVLKEQIGASDSQFGIAMLIASAGAVMAMWTAPFFDRILNKWALVVLAVGMGVSFLLPGFSGTVTTFAILMLLATAFSGTLDVVMNARVSSIETVVGKSLMNFQHGIFSTAYAISALMTGLARASGMVSWQIFLIIAAIIALMSIVMLRPTPSDDASTSVSETPIRLGVVIILIGSVTLIGFFAEQSTEAWSALHLERSLGAGAVGGALGPALLGGTMAMGRFSGQFFVTHFGPFRLIVGASLVGALGSFIAASAGSIPTAYVGFIVLGLGVSVIAPMGFAIVGQIVPAESRTKAIGRTAAFGYIGFFVGPPIMGFLSEWKGLSASFSFVGLSMLLVPLLALPLAKRIRQSRRQ
ncbi:MAG: MFS transporter [Paracoccaceae bacterium]|nr:MFS transporter [Paracoccaceae bacterium]